MKNIVYILLVFSTLSFGQTKTWQQWQSDFDSEIFGSFSYGRWQNSAGNGLSDIMASVYKSNDVSGYYWEAFSYVNGLIHAWMASGDFKYLDLVLDVIEEDVDGAVLMSGVSSNSEKWPFKANLAKNNWFYQDVVVNKTMSEFNLDLPDYVNNANRDLYGYGNRTLSNGTSAGSYIALDEGMYYRNVSNVARIVHNNLGSIGSLQSNNGQTYQQRLDKIVDFLEDHVWARNFENSNIASDHYGKYIYRINTHMSSHLAMNALCLWVITGKQKYLTFLNEFLYNFKENPLSYTYNGRNYGTYLIDGVGLLDKLNLVTENGRQYYTWWSKWDVENSGNPQDVGHALAEYQILQACFEEGIGANPPAGELAIDQTLMDRLANGLQMKIQKGYTCSSGPNQPSLAYYFNGGGFAYGYASATSAYAVYNADILCYNEENPNGIQSPRVGNQGVSMYAARVLGVGGDSGPAFTPTGSGVTPSNFRPQVNSSQGNLLQLVVGDPYIEQGATWTDVEDGSGTIASPSSGSVLVDGGNLTTTIGTYTLVYSYTDTGGLTDSDVLTVEVTNGANTRPELTLSFTDITITQFGTYTPPTYSWTDVEDGSGTTGAVIGGDTVDTSTPGQYTVSFTFTDSGGLSDTDLLVVTVAPFGDIQMQSLSFSSPNPFYITTGRTDFPEFTFSPPNTTNPGLEVIIGDQSILESQPTDELSYQMLALQPGITTLTLRSTDGSNLEVIKQVIVRPPSSVISFIIQN